uniref:Uncharacterized protein n=1 Tax=Anguilla anguilla TaxID=7936 RepID=A0A0E9W7T3_ANGAN
MSYIGQYFLCLVLSVYILSIKKSL